MKILRKKVIVGLALLTSSLFAVELTNVELDMLILYSKDALRLYSGDIETRVNHLMATTNKIYEDSGLKIRLNPTGIELYDIDDKSSSVEVLSTIQSDKNVTLLRDKVGADSVIIYRPYANDGACGLAYQNNYLNDSKATWVEKYSFAHISIDCGTYVTAHEIGHTTGLGHSTIQNSSGAYPYARGHGVQDAFTTIMAYAGSYNGTKLYKYSSPHLECKGLPCGIEAGEKDEADAVKALTQTVPLVAKFREHVVVKNSSKNLLLDELLQSYQTQKEVVASNKEELKKLREIVEKKRVLLRELKNKYNKKVTKYSSLREEYLLLRENYKKLVAKYHQAKMLQGEELLSLMILTDEALLKYKTYYVETISPVRDEMQQYKEYEVVPAQLLYKEASQSLKTFYTDIYQPSKSKLEELNRKYQELQSL